MSETEPMPLNAPLEQLQAGKRIRRTSWGAEKKYLELAKPGESAIKVKVPTIYLVTAMGPVPWFDQADMLASDWVVVE